MDSPVARLFCALLVLAIFAWALMTPAALAQSSRIVTNQPARPVNADSLLQTSRDYFVQQRYEEALAPTRALVELHPTTPVYIERLALIYQRLQRHAEEAAAWERFIEHSPTPADACPAIANAYEAAQQVDQAVSARERCWAMAPTRMAPR